MCKYTRVTFATFIINEKHEFLTSCSLYIAALMDAESRILGRQFWGALCGAAERPDKATLESKLINCWNIHAGRARVLSWL